MHAKSGSLLGLAVCVTIVGLSPIVVSADPSVLSFSYHTLSGSFTPTAVDAGYFEARATSALQGNPALYTTGSVTRLVDPVGKADFNFYNLFRTIGGMFDPRQADFVLSMSVSDIDRIENTAVGAGTLLATDVDGDTITATVSGRWVLIGGQATFAGAATNVVFSDPAGLFEGQFGTGFSTDFSDYEQLLGVVTDVTGVSGGLFESGFVDHSSLVTSQLIPAPGALLLGLIGMSLTGRIRTQFRQR